MREFFVRIWKYRELLFVLAKRQIKIKYKQALLGFCWALFVPFSTMLVFVFVFNKIAGISTGDVPYPVFVYSGLLAWTFFAQSLTSATNILIANSNLLTKIYFPREVFPLSAIISHFVDFLIGAVFLMVLCIFYRTTFHLTIFLLPVILTIQIILTVGLSLLLSMGNLFFRDVKHIWEAAVLLWMFATSVVYPISATDPVLRKILFLNPMTPIINNYRSLIFDGKFSSVESLIVSVIVSILVFVTGIKLFYKYEHLFAENI